MEDEDKNIVEGIVKSRNYSLIECRGALKISGKENIMEVFVEKDNNRTLIKYDDAAIVKPWRIGQFEFTLLQEALDNIHIPLAKLQKEADKREANTSKKMLITEKIQRQHSFNSTNLPLFEKERREIRGEEISNKFIILEDSNKKKLKENYNDFEISFDLEEKHKDDNFPNWTWNYGTFSKLISPTTKIKKKFEFTLLEMYDENSDYTSYEVTWIDKTPLDHEKIEELIINRFKKENNEE